MKRSRFGAALLVVLLLLGFGAQWGVRRCQSSVADTLRQAAEAALAEDWEKTEVLTKEAQSQWQKNYGFSAALVDHDPLEQIDAGFAVLEIWQNAGASSAMAAECVELESMIRALIEEQKLTWQNLL